MMPNKEEKILTLLGFARKAGKVVSGEQACLASLDKGQAALCIIAKDATDKNRFKWQERAAQSRIPAIEISDKISLGSAIGMSPRNIVCLTDEEMTRAILRTMT